MHESLSLSLSLSLFAREPVWLVNKKSRHHQTPLQVVYYIIFQENATIGNQGVELPFGLSFRKYSAHPKSPFLFFQRDLH